MGALGKSELNLCYKVGTKLKEKLFTVTCPIILLVRHFGGFLPGELADLLKNKFWLRHGSLLVRREHTGGYGSSG